MVGSREDCPEAATHATNGTIATIGDDATFRVTIREARLFRARLLDALDEAAERLARDLAADVLARELRIAPCDLAAIVRRLASSAPAVRVHIARDESIDEQRLRAEGLAVVRDEALHIGDAILELPDGSIDGRLGVRIADILTRER